MDAGRLPLQAVYELSQEYRNQAYAVSNRVRTESQLAQYYTLISMSIRTLRYIKQVYPLSIEQDARATFDLIDLLLRETHNMDMAESYLSSLRERLLNHQISGSSNSLMDLRMHAELLLLYRIPIERNSKFHYKAALRSCDQLLKHLFELQDTFETFKDWIQVFQYVSMSLNRKLRKHSIVKAQYAGLQFPNDDVQWQGFITLSHVNYLLNNRLPVPLSEQQRLANVQVHAVHPRWYAWKLLLELIIQIHEDKNISEKLKEFKTFFTQFKDSLDNIRDEFIVKVGSNLVLSLESSFLLSYKDMKNLLLLLQSVSYLVNCHDKKANFSIKFLAKVVSTTKNSLDAVENLNGLSISEIDAKTSWYGKVLSFSKFYQVWQSILLISEAPKIPSQHDFHSALLTAVSFHLRHKGNELSTCEQYEKLTNKNDVSSEIKLISLINSYLIRAALVSKNIQRQEQTKQCNALWDQIVKTHDESDLPNNATLDCTLTMIWIMSHFEPFTSNPMPAAESEKSRYLEKLRVYYSANKLQVTEGAETTVGQDNSVADGSNENLSLKKSLMMQIVLNYLGGRLFEQDLETICQISAACYRLAKVQSVPIILYIVGVWHLTNCTLAMKTKEVTILSAKLQLLEKKLYEPEL